MDIIHIHTDLVLPSMHTYIHTYICIYTFILSKLLCSSKSGILHYTSQTVVSSFFQCFTALGGNLSRDPHQHTQGLGFHIPGCTPGGSTSYCPVMILGCSGSGLRDTVMVLSRLTLLEDEGLKRFLHCVLNYMLTTAFLH